MSTKKIAEIVPVAETLAIMVSGLALPPAEANKVKAFIEAIRTAPVVKINKSDVEAAVKKNMSAVVTSEITAFMSGLEDKINELVANAVAEALEAKSNA
jgi:CHASE3 domain sensor protein